MLELNLTKNENDVIQGVKGKYYARVEYKDTYTLNKLAKHMHQHNTVYSKGVIVGVLTDMVACIKELCLEGNVIKIDDLGLFKCSVEGNGLTLASGSKVSAGVGAQRTDEELQANPAAQQFAVGAVKLIMQASGETTKDDMTDDATLTFTSKTKQLVKSLTGADATDSNGNSSGSGTENGGGSNTGESGSTTNGSNGTNGSGTGSITPSGGDNGGGSNTGGNGGDDDPDPEGDEH